MNGSNVFHCERMARRPTLVTIPASNYVEKARWALQLARIAFDEEPHVPLFHRRSTKPKGGSSVPLLFFPDTRTSLIDSSDITDYCAQTLLSLYPPAPETKELMQLYDTKLGPHTRRLVFFLTSLLHLANEQAVDQECMVAPADGWGERTCGSLLFFPFIKGIIVRGMAVNEQGAYRSGRRGH